MTDSSISWPSPAEPGRAAVIACGALAGELRAAVSSRGWDVEVHLLPALLHNHPREIAPRVEALAQSLIAGGRRVVVAYADCGTYGALDGVCTRLGIERLAGAHCYELFAGLDTVAELFDEEPGTYLLTDFLVRTFSRTVLVELGLDRHPELWNDYFGHYRRLVWLAQAPTPELRERARDVAARFALPLLVREVGRDRLTSELERLLETAAPSGGEPRE